MNRSMLKKLVSLLMAITLLAGCLPAGMMRSALAALTTQSRAIYGEPMDWVLSADGEPRTSGEWTYYVIQPQQYAVITGHADSSVQSLSVPAVLDGADVVGLAGGALADHHALESLRLPGNVNALASDALPRGVTILGYNGTYAQRFAQSVGHPFQSLSTYDFLSGVVDYADVAVHAFQRISAHEMRMRELEAARLAAGSRFFLIDPNDPYQISYYRVTSISAPDAGGFVTLACSTPEIDEVLASYEGTDETLVLDPDSLVLTEGTTLLNAAQSRSGNGFTTPVLTTSINIPISSQKTVKIDVKASSGFTASFSGEKFIEKELTVIETRTTDVTISYERDFLAKDEEKDLSKDEKELDLLQAIEQARTAAAATGDEKELLYTANLGNGLFFSLGGVVSLQVQFKTEFKLDGSAAVTFHEISEHTYHATSYGAFYKTCRTLDKGFDIEGKLEGKAGICVELTGFIGPVGLLQARAFAGFRLTFIYTITPDSLASEVPMSPNMADCLTLKIDFIIEIGIKAGLLKILDLQTDWLQLSGNLYSETFVLSTILDLHMHMLPHEFVPGETPGTFRYDSGQPKEQTHLAKNCPYTGASVAFLLPQAENEKDRLYYESSSCEKGFFINPPADPFRDRKDVRFLGWYSTNGFLPGTEVSWPYTLTDSETFFYGKYEVARHVSFEYASGEIAAPEVTLFPGDVFALPEVNIADPFWYACIRHARTGYTRILPLADVVEMSAGQVVMPDMDLRLIAMEEALLPVSFYESVDNGSATLLLTTYALAGSTLNAPPSSDPGMSDKGWVDASGAEVSFPYAVPEDQTAALHFIHNLSTEIPEGGSGEGGTSIGGYYPGNSYGTQTGAEAFYYNEYANYVRITGYNPTRYYYDDQGVKHSYTVTGYNLVIPATINNKPVTHIATKAFQGMDSLLTITFPDSITSMGDSAVANCPNLGYIDMGGVDINVIPSYFALNCTNLVEVRLPSRSGLTYGSYCFMNTGLSSAVIRGSVGISAFENCKNLANLTITDGCSTIGTNAFKNCTALKTASVSCTKIELSAFYGCTALETLTLADGLTSVATGAFQNCSSLKALVFPDSVTNYGYHLIMGCTALEELTVGGGCTQFTINARYNSEPVFLPVFYIGDASALRKLVLREGITTIADSAFANRLHTTTTAYTFPNLTSASFPSTLKTIGAYAFPNTSITDVTIKGAITSIGNSAFINSADLQQITIIGPVTSIGASAFTNSTSLQNVTIAGSGCTINSQAFRNTPALQHVELSGVTRLINQAFYDAGMRSISLGDDLTIIQNEAFYNCSNLKSLSIPDSVTEYGYHLTKGCTALEELTVGGGCTKFIVYTWYNSSPCYLPVFYIGSGSVLTRLVLREGITTIADSAFANRLHTSTTAYTFPNLTSVSFPSTLKTIGSYAFPNTSITDVTIKGAIASIGSSAFVNSADLQQVTVIGPVTGIGAGAFTNCISLQNVTIDGSGCTIRSKAFQNTPALQHVELSGVTVLDNQAFYDAGMRSISLGDGLTAIRNETFYNCSNLKSLSIPDSVTQYGYHITRGCTALEELTIGGGCTQFTIYTWYYNSPVYVPVFYIGPGSALRKLVLREGITDIPDNTFANRIHSGSSAYTFPNLTSVSFPSTLKSIGSYAFPNTSITDVTIKGAIASIGNKAFINSADLQQVTVIGPVTSIGSEAFSNSTSLQNVTIEGAGFAIGSNAFQNTPSLQHVELSGVTMLATKAFYNAGMRSISLGDDLTTIQTEAFYNCYHLKSLSIPDSVTNFGYHIIRGCTALEELTVGGGCKQFSIYTRYYSSYVHVPVFYIGPGSTLTKLVLREGITDIPDSAFANRVHTGTTASAFPNLTTVSLPSTLTTIGANNLRYWPSVTTLRLGEGITSLGDTVKLPWMTLVTDEYHEYAAAYAAARGAQYLALDPADYPSFTVSFVSAVAGVNADEKVLEDGTVLVSRISVPYRSTYQAPEVTAPEGYTFAGWYKDAAFTRPAPVNDLMGLQDLTLHARFVPRSAVTFALLVPAGRAMDNVTDGASLRLPQGFGVYALTAQAAGMPITLPEAPMLNGYLFAGWFHDAALSEPFTGGLASQDGLTLYGGFVPGSMGGSYQLSGEGLMISDYRLLESDGEALLLPDHLNGEAVRGIADYAFDDCAITSVTLPSTLTFVQPHAFTGCGTLSSISVPEDSAAFTSRQGVLYSKDMTILYRYPQGKPSTSFTVPDTVTAIAPYAFENCTALRSVTLPDSVVHLGDHAFAGCEGMVSFTARSLVTIGENALPGNAHTAVFGPLAAGPLRDYCMACPILQRNYNPRYLTIILDGKTVEMAACEAGLPLPADYAYGELPGGGYVLALYRDAALTTLWNMEADLMPDADLTLYTTASPLFAAEEITLVTGTQTAGDGTVTDVTLTGMQLTAYNGRGGDVVLPRTLNGLPVIAIGESFLASAHGDVNSVDIGDAVIQISSTAMVTPAEYRFAGDILAEPDTYAARWAAEMGYMCSGSLYTLTFNTMGGASAAAKQATANAFVKLPTPVRSGAAFLGWYLDEALTAPAVLDADGLFVMPAASLTLYAAWEQVEAFHFPYEYTESADGVTITAYTGTGSAEVMPGEVNGIPVIAIGDSAFAASSLTSLTLPDSVLTIGSRAFTGSALQSLTANGVQSVGSMAFYGCASLTGVTLSGVQTIGDEAFSGCTALSAITLPETLHTIGRYAFSGCTALTGITLPDSLTSLGSCAFLGCTDLNAAHIGSGLTVLGNRAFTGCIALPAFTVSDGGRFIANQGVLFGNGGLTLACCPGGFTGDYAIPDGTADVAANAFEQCVSLTSVTFPDGPVSIGASAFTGCTALTYLALGGSLAIPDSLCSGCTALTSVTLGESIASIGAYAFMHCRQLSSVHIGAQVADIGSMAFADTASGFTITGDAGTAAQAYALSNHHLFTLAQGADVENLTLPESLTLAMGDQLIPGVTVLPTEAAPTAALLWRTDDESIAIVTDGVLRALRRGETTLTVTAHNGVTASAKVIVTGVPAETVVLPEIAEELARGNTLALTASVSPAWAEDTPLVWTSSDESVATVDENGVVTALQAGEVTIRATANSGRWGETVIRVFHAVEALVSADAALTMHPIGETAVHQLAITCLPADHTYADLTFASSDTAIARVDAAGQVTALKVGQATITVTALRTRGEAVTLEIPVTVEPYDLSGLVLPDCEPLAYTGEALAPAPVIQLHGKTLAAGTDFLILTDGCIHTGDYPYTLQGQGNFTGEVHGEFSIVPAPAGLTCAGPQLLELCNPVPGYATDFPVEVAVLYASAAEPDHFTADLPTEPGSYTLRLATPGTADVLPATLDLPITLVESYLRTISLSCDALTLFAGQTVTPELRLILEEGTPENAATFLWASSSEAVSVSEAGALTALTEGAAEVTFTRTDRPGEQLTLPVTVLPAEPVPTLTLPASLTAIEDEAFLGVGAVRRIILPDTIQAIGSAAFAEMPALSQVQLPAAVTALPADLLRSTTAVLLCPIGTDAAAAAAEADLPYVLID